MDEQKTDIAAPPAETKAVPRVKAILAKKIGMTRVFSDKGEIVPVTVFEAGPCRVVQVKTPAKDGYAALQLGFGATRGKNMSAPEKGHFAKTGGAPTRWLQEFRLPGIDGFEAGMEIRVDQFAAGDVLDATGLIKGKGFAGAVKRHRFKGGPQTHGQSDRWRAPGSSGRERVWPGKRGPGHMGDEIKTVQRLEVVSVDPQENVLLLKGSVPGANGTCVRLVQTTRPRRVKHAAAAPKKAAKAAPAKGAPAKAGAKPEKK
jgi:large subunit ribosomal protein L3